MVESVFVHTYSLSANKFSHAKYSRKLESSLFGNFHLQHGLLVVVIVAYAHAVDSSRLFIIFNSSVPLNIFVALCR